MSSSVPIRHDPAEKILASLLVGFFFAISLVGSWYYRAQRAESLTAIRDQLSAVADLKVAQIVRWRGEALGDGKWIHESGFMTDEAQAFFTQGGDESRVREQMRRSLESWRLQYEYGRIQLLDKELRVRLAIPAAAEQADSTLIPLLQGVLQTGTVALADLHLDPADGRIKMSLVVPLGARPGESAPAETVGLLVFEINPEDFLFPSIQEWPTPSQTAETLLVRREGDEVVYLNELRHRSGTALKLRFPMTKESLPAARLMRGEEGVVEGMDYRGKPTVAALRRIPGSPWGIVAKEDQAEIYAPLRRQAWVMGGMVAGLLLAVLLGLGMLWRNREVRFARHELEKQRLSDQVVRDVSARLTHALDSAQMGTFEYLPATGEMFWDERIRRIWGMTPTETVDIAVAMQRVHPEDRPRVEQTLHTAMAPAGAGDFATEYRILLPDGAVRWIAARGRFSFEGEGAPRQAVRMTGVHLDITDSRRLAEERERMLRELESKNEELEAILYASSHDLRSPLVNIEGFGLRLEKACAELEARLRPPAVSLEVREAVAPILLEQVPKALKFIRFSTAKMEALISGLLRVSRLGHVSLHLQPVELDRLVHEVVSAQEFQIQQAGADVQVEPLPFCTGDATLLNQVFSNLLDNALKYRDPGRPLQIRISSRMEGGRVICRVADNGRGIAPEHQAKIWGLFHRLHPEESIPGDGLGLNLVRRILNRHGGRVWVESVPGEGSCFYLSLPV